MKIAVSKHSLVGDTRFAAGFQFDNESQVDIVIGDKNFAGIQIEDPYADLTASISEELPDGDPKLIPSKAKIEQFEKRQGEVIEFLEELPIHVNIDPGFVDPATFGEPTGLGRIKFARKVETGDWIKFRALGVSEEKLLEGFQVHNPSSYPEIEVVAVYGDGDLVTLDSEVDRPIHLVNGAQLAEYEVITPAQGRSKEKVTSHPLEIDGNSVALLPTGTGTVRLVVS